MDIYKVKLLVQSKLDAEIKGDSRTHSKEYKEACNNFPVLMAIALQLVARKQ